LILVSTQVYRGQRLTLSNVQTKAALECVVAHIDSHQSDHPQVGVEFILPNPMFWHVAFPPKDWTPRHPDAKSRIKTRESSWNPPLAAKNWTSSLSTRGKATRLLPTATGVPLPRERQSPIGVGL